LNKKKRPKPLLDFFRKRAYKGGMTNAPFCFCEKLFRVLSSRLAALAIAVAGFGSLAVAFTAQYGFGVAACSLCWAERVPYLLVALLGTAAFFQKPYEKRGRVLVAVCAAIFFSGFCLAAYHSGIERHWWGEEGVCFLTPTPGESASSLREQLLSQVAARCDQLGETIFGLSFANLNVLASLGLSVLAALASVLAGKTMPTCGCKCRRGGKVDETA